MIYFADVAELCQNAKREQLIDYFINREFRKDIFVRGVRRLSRTEAYEKILSMRYVLTKPAATVVEFISVLVHMGHVMPCQSEETVKQVKKSCERLNAHI